MNDTFAALKRERTTSFDKLTKEVEKLSSNNQQNRNEDDRYWKPETDKAGNGYAVIRFLPAPQGEDVPFVRIWNHGFQGPGGWYIENSLTTIGQQDPVGEYNSKLWNSGNESDKDIVRKQKRRLTYISNIYIVSDPSNPQNEGKVFLYKYGKKIFDKINEQMNPTFQDETAVNPFDLWEGANFKMKIRHVEGYRNYDKSEFDAPSPLLEDDDEMEKVWNSQHSLAAFIAPDQFKSYDQLKARLDRVLGLKAGAASRDEDVRQDTPPAPVAEPTVGKSAKASWDDNEDDDNLAFFEKLAEDDE
jgi:hypothetical protein|tara:strand:+ start:3276 stop:4181 length:906 start_codon:yes stop_codon:yes gene_type:complete